MGIIKDKRNRFARWPNTLKLLLNGDAATWLAFPTRTRPRSPPIALPKEKIQLSLKGWPRWQLPSVPLTPTMMTFSMGRSSKTSCLSVSRTVKLEACPSPAEKMCPRTSKKRCTHSSFPIAVRVLLVSLWQASGQGSLQSERPWHSEVSSIRVSLAETRLGYDNYLTSHLQTRQIWY